MRSFFRIFSGIVFFFVISLLTVIVFSMVQAKGDIEKTPSFFGYRALTVLSNSMQPAFSAGDLIVINNNQEPKVGNIVTYKHPDGMLVSHRVILAVNQNGQLLFKTKGDHNNTDDNLFISRKDILGIEQMTVPKAGYAAKFVSSPIGLLIFVIIPILALLVIEILEKFGVVKGKEHEQSQIN